jgi:hypothetical protein
MATVNEEASVGWMRQCSKHLSHMETRMMAEAFMGHEVVRQIAIHMERFSPPPRGDWGWMLRKCTDIGVRTLRQLVKVYHRGTEDMRAFLERAMQLVRLYFEEAFHRTLMGAEGSLRKSAFCAMMVTMRAFEIDTLPSEHSTLGMFWTFSEDFVRMLAMKIGRHEVTSIEVLPSYEGVMKSADMRVEAFSLMLVRVLPSSIAMSNAEIKERIEANGGAVEDSVQLGGSEGPSRFIECFPDEASCS